MSYRSDTEPVTVETLAANARWDLENGMEKAVGVPMDPHVVLRARQFTNVVGRPLTDKKIREYEEAGYYSEAYREARREAMARRKAKRVRREGNFLVYPDGRKVYSPE